MSELLRNPLRRPALRYPEPDTAPRGVHRRLPGYAPTPLRSLAPVAARFGLGAVWLKDESSRLGLPAYKVLGAAWATYRTLAARLGTAPEPWRDVEELRARIAGMPPLRLITATDGNHGRGVARVARWLGWPARVYLPQGSAPARLAGIRGEGAEVIEVAGTYDAAVARAAEAATGTDCLLIQDHGWPGYEEVPAWVAEGYETIFAEVDEALDAAGEGPPDVVLVQVGVGTLASAVVRHFRRQGLGQLPLLLAVEPTGAACALRSIAAGAPVLLEAGADASIMAGLNCGTPSTAAWPDLRDGVDAFVAVEDAQAAEAMRTLAGLGVVAGESGAAGLAGLMELMALRHAAARAALGLSGGSRVLLLNTEGATDPASWERIVGHAPPMPR
jgi:diaminopropionate ammonia-lyase